jgi:hypothetical protein
VNKDLSNLLKAHEDAIEMAIESGRYLLLKSTHLHVAILPGVRCRKCSGPVPKVQGRRLCLDCSPQAKQRRKPIIRIS